MNRKGISPIIAVLLLVIIAVAAAVLTYLWVLGYIGTVQQQGGTESLQERIKIEGVEISGGTINTVYVRNIGDVNAEIDTVYLIDPTGSSTDCDVSNTELTPGTLSEIDTSGCGFGVTSGETYVIKVVTTTGAEASYSFTYKE